MMIYIPAGSPTREQATNEITELWLEKVCINQQDSDNGLAVLPISMAYCKKVLVLLGENYTSRLWCMWELFRLFTFCNKEIAMDRLRILLIVAADNKKKKKNVASLL